MEALYCMSCGGKPLTIADGIATCPNCGTQHLLGSPEEISEASEEIPTISVLMPVVITLGCFLREKGYAVGNAYPDYPTLFNSRGYNGWTEELSYKTDELDVGRESTEIVTEPATRRTKEQKKLISTIEILFTIVWPEAEDWLNCVTIMAPGLSDLPEAKQAAIIINEGLGWAVDIEVDYAERTWERMCVTKESPI